MGRLIDIDKARKEYSNLTDLTMNDTTLLLTLFGVLDNAPTVEAIPKAVIQKALKEASKDISENVLAIVREEYIGKADYENRLKADMVAILTEIQVGIGEHVNPSNHTDSYEDGWSEGAEWCIDYIQQKINSLKENKDETHD